MLCDIAADILKRQNAEEIFGAFNPFGDALQVQAGAKWLQMSGVNATQENTLICSGVQNALTIILAAMFEKGDRIAVDPYTYPNFIGLATMLQLQLVPVENDDSGMCSDVLHKLCRTQKIKGIYIMPTGGNPTNIGFSDERRIEIAKLIEEYNLIAIEDDNYSILSHEIKKPVVTLAPENCFYISGLSKPISPGLRIAYMYMPKKYTERLERASLNINLKLSTINAEIATELILNGIVSKIVNEKRAFAIVRNKIYNRYFPGEKEYLETYCQWLTLPPHCSGRNCEIYMSKKGIRIFGAERFSVGNQIKNNAVRVATCSPKTDESLEIGLLTLRQYIDEKAKRKID